MTPKQVSDADQALKWTAESLPRLWRTIYEECINQGFTADQAMDLLKTYITAMHLSK